MRPTDQGTTATERMVPKGKGRAMPRRAHGAARAAREAEGAGGNRARVSVWCL